LTFWVDQVFDSIIIFFTFTFEKNQGYFQKKLGRLIIGSCLSKKKQSDHRSKVVFREKLDRHWPSIRNFTPR